MRLFVSSLGTSFLSLSHTLPHVILICAAVVSLLYGMMTIGGDGIGYYYLYHQVRQGDIALSEQFDPPPQPQQYVFVPARAGWSTYFQAGTAFVWAVFVPFFSALPPSSFDAFAVAWTSLPSFLVRDGFAIMMTAFIAAIAAGWCVLRILQEHLPMGGRDSALIATALAFFGMPTWYYTFQSAAYAHMVELAFLCAALAIFLRTLRAPSIPRFIFCGTILGCAALVRIDALLYTIVFCALMLWKWRYRGIRFVAALALPALVFASIQFALWWNTFGSLLPPRNYTVNDFVLPGLYSYHVLFSNLRGFFVWSPVAIAGVAGLAISLRDVSVRERGVLGIGLLILYTIFYGSWSMWWGGSSAGQRFLIPLFPFIAIGIALFLARARLWPRKAQWTVRWGLFAAVVFSLMLAVLYDPLAPGLEKESHSFTGLLATARREYGFPSLSSFPRLFNRVFWYDPRPIHYVLFLTD